MTFPSILPIPDEVLRIAETLEGVGHETWCVGGAVRDNLLGLENKDFDLATAATPKQVQKLFRRTVPIGIDHGTVAVIDRGGRLHEVTTFRKDVQTDGRHAIVEFGVSLDEDLARRDLFGGEPDLSGKLIRAVGDPSQRFREDYLRILRALRFAARFGFEIENATWGAAVDVRRWMAKVGKAVDDRGSCSRRGGSHGYRCRPGARPWSIACRPAGRGPS